MEQRSQEARKRVAVIGAGIVGCCIARELCRHDVQVTVLEAGNDLACGATRANSGIVHAGFDPQPGTLKAFYNVRGSQLFPIWAEELGWAFYRNGSMVAAFSDDELPALGGLLERGRRNGVEGLRLVGHEEALELEPNLSPDVRGALVAPTGGICDPYGAAFGAAENAAMNGAAFEFAQRVCAIDAVDGGRGGYIVRTQQGGRWRADAVVNVAGVHADEMNNLVSAEKLAITPVRGDYMLYETSLGALFHRTVFQVPGAQGKGVLVSPTIHGNLFIGPDAFVQDSKESLATTAEGLGYIVERARRTWPDAGTRGQIANFAGLRASGSSRDFAVGQAPDAPFFFNAACIDSPGLTSAPAIAQDIAQQVADALGARPNPSFDPHRPAPRRMVLMSPDELEAAAKEDPLWGHAVCRCCKVSEAEIVRELHGPIPVLELDALKWRTGATMGECHGGFCTPEIVRIVCRELGYSPDQVEKRLAGSWMLTGSRPDYAELSRAPRPRPKAPEAGASYDVAVVGAGAAGLAAAKAAAAKGARTALLDRSGALGGILGQCVHSGFGLARFDEELTGPEYAVRESAGMEGLPIDVFRDTTVLGASPAPGEEGAFELQLASSGGCERVRAGAVVLATGSRERGFGALNIAGARPSGVYSAGTAQAFINLQGCLPGRRAVVLGSGDIGLIMARRMALEGMEVLGVFEIMPYPSGLRRNIVQCLDDFGIPLSLSSTVVRVEGAARLEAVWVASVDPSTRRPVPGTERRIECDTLVLSVGLIPENALAGQLGARIDPRTGGPEVDDSLQTTVPGVFSCGNSLHVHDLADWASEEGDAAGAAAAEHALRGGRGEPAAGHAGGIVAVVPGEGVGHVVPQRVRIGAGMAGEASLSLRVSSVMRKPVLEAVGVAADGAETVLKRKRARIAVPAEMVRIPVPLGDAGGFDRIEVRAHAGE